MLFVKEDYIKDIIFQESCHYFFAFGFDMNHRPIIGSYVFGFFSSLQELVSALVFCQSYSSLPYIRSIILEVISILSAAPKVEAKYFFLKSELLRTTLASKSDSE